MNMNISTTLPNGFYLALVYLVISGNYLGNLFGCRTQQLFQNNMWIKHLLGLFTTYFLIVLSTPPEGYSAIATVGLATAIYAWFFLTTKMHVNFWIPMILAILLSYFLYVYKKQTAPTAPTDPNNAATAAKTEQILLGQKAAVLFAAILTVLGVVTYFGEKRIEYGDKFDAWTFWTGVPVCRKSTPSISITKSLSAAVGL